MSRIKAKNYIMVEHGKKTALAIVTEQIKSVLEKTTKGFSFIELGNTGTSQIRTEKGVVSLISFTPKEEEDDLFGAEFYMVDSFSDKITLEETKELVENLS